MKIVYKELASLVDARERCLKDNNTIWFDNHTNRIEEIIKEYLPHGSGFDGITKINYDRSSGERLHLTSEFHAMDDNGSYDEWIYFRIIITPSLQFGFNMNIIGNFGKYQSLKDDIGEMLDQCFNVVIEEEKKTKENQCPKCKSSNLHYPDNSRQVYADSLTMAGECKDCDCEFEEYFHVIYDSTTIIKGKNKMDDVGEYLKTKNEAFRRGFLDAVYSKKPNAGIWNKNDYCYGYANGSQYKDEIRGTSPSCAYNHKGLLKDKNDS